jgi:hypothetical protein
LHDITGLEVALRLAHRYPDLIYPRQLALWFLRLTMVADLCKQERICNENWSTAIELARRNHDFAGDKNFWKTAVEFQRKFDLPAQGKAFTLSELLAAGERSPTLIAEAIQ